MTYLIGRLCLNHGQPIALLFSVNIMLRRLALATLLLCSLGAPAFAADGSHDGHDGPGDHRNDHGKMPDKVDRALAGQLKGGTVKNKVLITVTPG